VSKRDRHAQILEVLKENRVTSQEGRENLSDSREFNESIQIQNRRRVRGSHREVVVRQKEKVQGVVTGACPHINQDNVGIQFL